MSAALTTSSTKDLGRSPHCVHRPTDDSAAGLTALVDDAATVELMKAFYTPIIKSGASYGAALTDAKRKLIATQKWQHPFYWAAFVLVGS